MTLLTPREPVEPKFTGGYCNKCFHLATGLVQTSFTQWDARCPDHDGPAPSPDSIHRVNKRSAK